MNASLFLASLLIAVAGPIIAVAYLQPILRQVLRLLCDAQMGAEFWVRRAYLLVVTGTVTLMLAFGRFDDGAQLLDTLRRALLLVLVGVFATVALIARNVWSQVRQVLAPRAQTPPSRLLNARETPEGCPARRRAASRA